jgi:hypothetical protein
MYSNYDMIKRRKRIDNISELKVGDNYIILENESTYIDGDERSRTNPGHGYPGYTAHSINMILYYQDKEAWEHDIKGRTTQGDKFMAVVMRPAEVLTEVKVTINGI